MKLSINTRLIPGLCLWKTKGKVLRLVSTAEPIPDAVDEIALCLSDWETLAERVARSAGDEATAARAGREPAPATAALNGR